MYITAYGNFCFRLTSKYEASDLHLLIDPTGEAKGDKVMRITADIVTISHDLEEKEAWSFPNGTQLTQEPLAITTPGEYEAKGVFVTGVPSSGENGKQNTIFRYDIEGISFAHLGDLYQEELTEKQLEVLSNIDVIFFPIGGKYTINADQYFKTIFGQLEPRILIPMPVHGSQDSFSDADYQKLAGEIGITDFESSEKIRLSANDLPQDSTKCFYLKKEG